MGNMIVETADLTFARKLRYMPGIRDICPKSERYDRNFKYMAENLNICSKRNI